MAYKNILVAVAPSPEANQLVAKAVAIARPVQGSITLITQSTDPEIYNQFAAPMLADLRELMNEETVLFLHRLTEAARYPIADQLIVTGYLSEHIGQVCRERQIDLVICGNHNQTLFNKLTCSSKPVIANCCTDVLLVALR
ncbi:universal stress protein C [Salmonella enterica subsp. enterica serovar Choleraesuis]|nr:universal stress protein C [Salmonella enterica subsp. enterica serovar Choleraesuis]